MNAFIFVAVMCMGQSCDFATSNRLLSEQECNTIVEQFYALPFRPEVTIFHAKCAPFKIPETT